MLVSVLRVSPGELIVILPLSPYIPIAPTVPVPLTVTVPETEEPPSINTPVVFSPSAVIFIFKELFPFE